jgi:hypothetical protein
MHKFIAFALLTIGTTAAVFAQDQLSGSLQRDLAATRMTQTAAHAETFAFDDAVALPAKKSASLAIMYSLILPGAGEMYVGGFDAGKYPLIAEGGLWLTWGTMQYYGGWLRNDARQFAVEHAGVASTSAGDQFYVDVSNFNNTYDYNTKKLRDRSADLLYTSAATSWQWDSDANRQQFREQRVSSDRVFNNARFVIGGMLLNRIISAINAARLVRQFNRSILTGDSGLGNWRLESSMLGMDGVQVALVRTF